MADLAEAAAQLARELGWGVEALDEIDSTNTEARRRLAEPGCAPPPWVLLADFQTAGMGRAGRRWVAPRGTSLLATVAVPESWLPAPRSLAPLRVGLLVREALSPRARGPIELKWPNDILLAGGKVGGILCELSDGALLAGVGINATTAEVDLPGRPATAPPAASLNPGGGATARIDLVLAVIRRLAAGLRFPAPREAVLRDFRAACVTFGQAVAFPSGDGTVEGGIARDIDDSGALVVELPGGGRRHVGCLSEEA